MPWALVASMLVCGSCGPGGDVSTPPAFDGRPSQTVVSTSGALSVDVRWSPDPPVVGIVAAQLTIFDLPNAAQSPAEGLSLAVLPWMPAHGHGTSTVPLVEESAPGIYTVTRVNLFMAGEWQLRTTVSGPLDDTFIAAIGVH